MNIHGALIAKTANGDTVYGWYDGNNTVEEIVGVQFKDEETSTKPTNSVKNADGSFTVTIKGVTYKVVFTFTVGEDGKTTITVTMTEETQQTEQQAAKCEKRKFLQRPTATMQENACPGCGRTRCMSTGISDKG